MTTKEFKAELENLGVGWGQTWGSDYILVVIEGADVVLSRVHAEKVGHLSFTFDNHLKLDLMVKLMQLVIEYATTPVDDRAQQEKFYWRLKGSKAYADGSQYLWCFQYKWWSLKKSKKNAGKYTQKEYDELVEEEVIADIFEKVPAE